MRLTSDDRQTLESLLRGDRYDGSLSARAKIVLLFAEGHSVREIAELTGTTRPTVYKWIDRYEEEGVDGLIDRKPTGRPPDVSDQVRARILALARQSPPAKTGLSHWSSREMAKYLMREEGIAISHDFIAVLWRQNGLQDRKSTRLNSSHTVISYAVFCLKKKRNATNPYLIYL